MAIQFNFAWAMICRNLFLEKPNFPILQSAWDGNSSKSSLYWNNYVKVIENLSRLDKNPKPIPQKGEFWDYEGKLVVITDVEEYVVGGEVKDRRISFDGFNINGFQISRLQQSHLIPMFIEGDLNQQDIFPVKNVSFSIINKLKNAGAHKNPNELELTSLKRLMKNDVISIAGQYFVFESYSRESARAKSSLWVDFVVLSLRELTSDGHIGLPVSRRIEIPVEDHDYQVNLQKAIHFVRQVHLNKPK